MDSTVQTNATLVLAPGVQAAISRVVSAQDVADFARLTGDDNPVHIDAEAAKAAGYDGPIVHGALMVGLASAVLGQRVPGPGSVFLSHTTKFRAAMPVGWEATATARVSNVRASRRLVTLDVTVTGRDPASGDEPLTLATGQALVLAPPGAELSTQAVEGASEAGA